VGTGDNRLVNHHPPSIKHNQSHPVTRALGKPGGVDLFERLLPRQLCKIITEKFKNSRLSCRHVSQFPLTPGQTGPGWKRMVADFPEGRVQSARCALAQTWRWLGSHHVKRGVAEAATANFGFAQPAVSPSSPGLWARSRASPKTFHPIGRFTAPGGALDFGPWAQKPPSLPPLDEGRSAPLAP